MHEKGLESRILTLLVLLFAPFMYAQTLPSQKEDTPSITLEKLPPSQNKKPTEDPLSRDTRVLEVKKPTLKKKSEPKNKKESEKSQKNEKKDTVLEELKLANQGLVTDDENSEETNPIKDANKDKAEPPHTEESQPNKGLEKPAHTLETKKSTGKPEDEIIEIESNNLDDKLKHLEQDKAELFAYFPTKQNFEKLMKKYVTLLESHPNESSIYWALFHLMHDYIQWTRDTPLYNSDVTEEAMIILQTIKERFNEQEQTSLYLCQYLILNDFKTEGLGQCNQAIGLHPTKPIPYIIKFQNSENKTDRQLLKILKKFPASPEVLVAVGQHFKDKKNYQLSQKYIEKALNMNPNFEKALFEMADILFLSQEYKQALTYYIQICEKYHMKARKPFRKAKSQLSQKNLFNLANEYQNSINQCISNTTLSPQHSQTMKNEYKLFSHLSDKV